LTALQPIKEVLVQFTARSGEKVRRQGLMAGQVAVFVTTNRFSATQPFYANRATVTWHYQTDFTPDLVEAAVQLLERLYQPGFHDQKGGLMLLDL
jgi:DNA polymerase V